MFIATLCNGSIERNFFSSFLGTKSNDWQVLESTFHVFDKLGQVLESLLQGRNCRNSLGFLERVQSIDYLIKLRLELLAGLFGLNVIGPSTQRVVNLAILHWVQLKESIDETTQVLAASKFSTNTADKHLVQRQDSFEDVLELLVECLEETFADVLSALQALGEASSAACGCPACGCPACGYSTFLLFPGKFLSGFLVFGSAMFLLQVSDNVGMTVVVAENNVGSCKHLAEFIIGASIIELRQQRFVDFITELLEILQILVLLVGNTQSSESIINLGRGIGNSTHARKHKSNLFTELGGSRSTLDALDHRFQTLLLGQKFIQRFLLGISNSSHVFKQLDLTSNLHDNSIRECTEFLQ